VGGILIYADHPDRHQRVAEIKSDTPDVGSNLRKDDTTTAHMKTSTDNQRHNTLSDTTPTGSIACWHHTVEHVDFVTARVQNHITRMWVRQRTVWLASIRPDRPPTNRRRDGRGEHPPAATVSTPTRPDLTSNQRCHRARPFPGVTPTRARWSNPTCRLRTRRTSPLHGGPHGRARAVSRGRAGTGS